MVVGAIVGAVIGMLLSGVLAKLFPAADLLAVQAAITAVSCLLGVVLDGTERRMRKERP
jgi:hypothetical protein